MSKILITGCHGQLGKELNRQLSENNDLILTDVHNLDIANKDQVYKIITEEKPEYIINAAAYTAVDLCEEKKDLAMQVNAVGPRNLSEISGEYNIPIIHISTDYVFDGNGIKNDKGILRPYIETDPTNPQNVYGQTKLLGENSVAGNNDKHFIIRTAWLYGDGNNFVRTMLKLAKDNDTLKIVNDQFGSPTSTKELVKMIKEVMNTDDYGIYHGTCEGQCSWYDFAKGIFDLKSIDIDIKPVTSEVFKRPAKRPHYSVLENKKLNSNHHFRFNNWKVALEDYLIQL